jgi:alpha-tubulin suppressor-like RCC1 family protein
MPNQFNSPEGDLENYFVTESFLIDQWVGDTLFTWGYNAYGQLGINNTTNRCTPVTTFAGGTNWKQVSSAVSATAAIKTDGTLWVWGRNLAGILGINEAASNTEGRCTPVQVFGSATNWKQVACGNTHMAAIKTDGTLWTWGENNTGQLGINAGTTSHRCTPVTTFAGGTNWKQVAGGNCYTSAIKTDGTLWGWGNNGSGQLGDNTTINRSTPVTTFAGGTNWKQVAGQLHTAAIKTDGTLWTWGYNANGQLGINNTTTPILTPVTTFVGGTNWKQVACGGSAHTAAIKTDGTLWTWGTNTSGELGNNTVTNRSTPVTTFAGGTNWNQVACHYYTAAIKTDGTLWMWGSNGNGYLGINDQINRSTPVTTLAGGTNWKQIALGGASNHVAAVTSGTDPTYSIS